ncbi:MAG: hypothetical protein E3J72_14675 [Planctomycetota bacterium]|nr:MAG: hypothetical protein E3J72_14675 [Planctomycetota bacterium]
MSQLRIEGKLCAAPFLLVLILFSFLSEGCMGNINADIASAIAPRKKKTKDHYVGMFFQQFYMNLENAKKYLDWSRKEQAKGRLRKALVDAQKVLVTFKIAEETYNKIVTWEWEEKHLESVEKIREIGKKELPDLKVEVENLKILKRELLTKLSPGALAKLYREKLYFPYLPDFGVPIDILGELRIRQKAAKGILEKIDNPDLYYRFREDSSRTVKQKKASIQVNLSIGYELLLTESEWLLRHAPPAQKTDSQKIIKGIRSGMPKLEEVYKRVGPMKLSKSAHNTFAWHIKEARVEEKARLKKKMDSIKITTK